MKTDNEIIKEALELLKDCKAYKALGLKTNTAKGKKANVEYNEVKNLLVAHKEYIEHGFWIDKFYKKMEKGTYIKYQLYCGSQKVGKEFSHVESAISFMAELERSNVDARWLEKNKKVI